MAHRAHEIGLSPTPDPGLLVRRDVRAVERAKRGLQRAATRIGDGVLLVLGVTAEAAAGLGKIFTTLGVTLR